MKYNLQVIQQEYDDGLSVRNICKKYGMSSRTFMTLGIKTRSRSEANKLYSKNNPQKHSIETKEKLSEIRIQALRENAFYSKRSTVDGVVLDSSYELLVANSLNENNIRWTRPKALKYNDNGQIRRYIPDFYLPDYDIYLDPKNDYLINKDQRKIKLAEEFNKVKIVILDKFNLDWQSIKTLL